MFFTRKEVNASYAQGEERKKLRTPSLARDSRFSAMENAKTITPVLLATHWLKKCNKASAQCYTVDEKTGPDLPNLARSAFLPHKQV